MHTDNTHSGQLENIDFLIIYIPVSQNVPLCNERTPQQGQQNSREEFIDWTLYGQQVIKLRVILLVHCACAA